MAGSSPGSPPPRPQRRGQAILAAALRLARTASENAVERSGSTPPVAVGFGTAGVVDPTGRRIRSATSALPGWADTDVADAAEQEFQVPATVLGDVQAFLAGESAHGVARGASVAVAVMAGTGIGGAVLVDGRVLRGAGGAAGHVGHVPVPGAELRPCPCGASGHVEALAAGPAMTAEAQRRLPGHDIPDLQAAAALARAGHGEARAAIEAGGAALGVALAGVIALLDPDLVVLGGGAAAAGPWFEAGLREALTRNALPLLTRVPVVRSSMDADAVLIGAAVEARTLLAHPASTERNEVVL
ncbi:ROK family protein [Kitasatospora paranensis]|uniref:ROK family protein n=1 Tax=Kitasatospora paranensis TaxID=258053 RepID=UPI0031E559C1